MALTKTRTSVTWASAGVLTAGAGNVTSPAQDLSTSYATVINILLVNGATGPTVPAQVQIQTSNDNTTYSNFGGPLVGSVTNSATTSWGGIELPVAAKYFQCVAGSNTAQNVTVSTDYIMTTAL